MKRSYTFLPSNKFGNPIQIIRDDEGNFIRYGFEDGACLGPCESIEDAIGQFEKLKERQIEFCPLTESDFVAWKVTGSQIGKLFHFKWI